MKAIVLVVILALSVAAKEEDTVQRYGRVKRDGVKIRDSITSNDGLDENSKFLNQYKDNEIKDQIADSTEKKELTITTEKKENKNRIGTKLTNIKNIVTHEDIEGHRSVLSEALLHQLHGPNEKVIFLTGDSGEEAKLEHIPSLIDPGHAHGQQVVLLPKPTAESIPENYHLQQLGDKVTFVQTGAEDKIQKLHLLPQTIENGFHHQHLHHQHHQHHQPSGKVLVLRKSHEDVLTNLHSHIHSPSPKLVYLPKANEESVLSLHDHAGHQNVFLLPKGHDESLSGLHAYSPHVHQKYVILPKGHEETLGAHHLQYHSLGGHNLGHVHATHSLGTHSLGQHSLGAHSLVHHSLGTHSLGGHPLGTHTLGPHTLGSHTLGPHTLGPHTVGTHPSLVHSLGNSYHIQAHGDKIVLLPKVTDETVAAINQLNSPGHGLVLLPNPAEEKHAKMHYLPSVFANNEVAYKSYGGGYTLPVAQNVLSNLNVEQGKVPVVISNMLGLTPSAPHSLVSHLHKNLHHQLSKNVLPQLVKHVKLADHQVDKNKHEIDLGAAIHHHFTIVKKVGIPYLKPYPVQIEQRLPYPYVQRVPVLVDRPYKVHVIKPYPVVSPYTKGSDLPVKVPLSYPTNYKGQVVFNVPKTQHQILVSKPDQISKSILIQKSEPVLVKHE